MCGHLRCKKGEKFHNILYSEQYLEYPSSCFVIFHIELLQNVWQNKNKLLKSPRDNQDPFWQFQLKSYDIVIGELSSCQVHVSILYVG